MELKDYTDEHLREELKRRVQERKAERDKVKRCKTCKHLGTVSYWGTPMKRPSNCYNEPCPFKSAKHQGRFRCANIYDKACENYEKL